MKIIRWVAALLCVLLIGSLFPTRAFAADIPWYLDAEGVLHITGEIPESGFNLTDEQKQQVKSAVAESGASISSGYNLFSRFENMTSADLSLLNTTGVTNMSYMFYGCSSLTSLNFSNINTSNFNTSSVTTMDGMFSGCSSLTSLDVSGFSTSNVTSMVGVFTNCSSLTSLNLSSFDTSSVGSMSSMFLGCSSLTSLDLSEFITGKVTNMGGMFCNCSGLTSLNLSSFDTSSVDGMSSMFSGCSSLTSLDISGFKTDKLMYTEEMFRGCSALTSLGIGPVILYKNADDIIAIRSPWQKQGSTDTYSTADELKAVNDTVTLLAMYTVNVQNDGNGTASANPTSAAKGSTVTLNESPNAGYHFKEWQSSDVTVNNNSFTMPEKNVTVKAIFEADEPNTYTVTFNMKGHGTQVAGQTVEDGNKATKPADPAASGWTFGGWYADATFSTKFDFNTAITANTTIYAKWTENTTPPAPTYNMIAGMGGEWTEGSMSGLSFTSDAPFAKFDSVQVDGSTIAAANYTAEEGPTKITLAPAYLETLSIGSHSIKIVSKDGSASTNFTVKAAAQPPVPAKYTVSFNMNGHGTQITAQTVESGSKATKPADPTASGWTFGGWYADATFSTKFDFNTAITANTTVYAKWTEITVPQPPVPTTYTVTFNMKGHGTQVAGQTVEDGNKATKPADPAASGWTFGGWYADATFSARFDFDTAITANTTIYAKWTENTTPPAPTYTMIAGADGEWTKGSTTGFSFTSDAPFAKFDSVQVDGSTIAAANYTAEEGSTKITLAPAYLETLSIGSHSIKIVSKDGSASTNFTVKAAAQPPVPAKYTVSFNMNGHGTQITAQTVESGSKATKPADPTASEYTFGGWYEDATFSTKFDFNTAITANTTAYAKWTKNSAAPADTTSPQTEDTGDMFLWIALLLVSGGALVGTTVYIRKKKNNAK